MSLVDQLEIGAGDVVVFVGGGGKSTLMMQAAHELVSRNGPVVLTTTTKMGRGQIPEWTTVCRRPEEVVEALAAGSVFLLRSLDSHKVMGVSPEVVDRVAESTDVPVLVEGDGARGRPFKAPREGEPVIPSSATIVVNVAGIDAIGQPIAACHRPERVADLLGLSVDDELTALRLAEVLSHPRGGGKAIPAGARRVAVLTKVEARHAGAVAEVQDAVGSDIPLVTTSRT